MKQIYDCIIFFCNQKKLVFNKFIDPTDRLDDIYMGGCLKKLNVSIIHSNRFHQVSHHKIYIIQSS